MQSFITLDIGNTRIKFATFDIDGKLLNHGFLLESELHDFVNGKSVIYSSVRSMQLDGLENATVFNHSMIGQLQVNIENLQTLGLDRLAAVLGVNYLNPNEASMIIDAGTCITFDYVSANLEYQGGAISPGISMRYRALNEFTGKLPELRSEMPELKPTEIGNRTDRAIHSGIVLGILDEIEGRIRRFKELNAKINVYITGGDAHFLAKHLENEIFVEPLLVHYGLYHAFKFA